MKKPRTHRFIHSITRPDGVKMTAIFTIPDGHKLVEPSPDVRGRTDQNVSELSEYAFMAAHKVRDVIEQCESSRAYWAKQREEDDREETTDPDRR